MAIDGHTEKKKILITCQHHIEGWPENENEFKLDGTVHNNVQF